MYRMWYCMEILQSALWAFYVFASPHPPLKYVAHRECPIYYDIFSLWGLWTNIIKEYGGGCFMIVIPPVKSKYNDGIPIKLKKSFKSS